MNTSNYNTHYIEEHITTYIDKYWVVSVIPITMCNSSTHNRKKCTYTEIQTTHDVIASRIINTCTSVYIKLASVSKCQQKSVKIDEFRVYDVNNMYVSIIFHIVAQQSLSKYMYYGQNSNFLKVLTSLHWIMSKHDWY